MKAKISLVIVVLSTFFVTCCLSRAALRRTPKVYNALITTDENLTSSQAYPVIQPTIHETGISHFPLGQYNGFGYYGPPSVVRFGQPIAPGLVAAQERLPYPLPHGQFPPQLMPPPPQQRLPSVFPGYPIPHPDPSLAIGPQKEEVEGVAAAAAANERSDGEIISDEQHPVVPPQDAPIEQQQQQNGKYIPMSAESEGPHEIPIQNGKLPIFLNEYGLPPSLIPLQQYPMIHRNAGHGTGHPDGHVPRPVNLPPYAFQQYPLLQTYYDPVTGFREQYLPPYDYAASPHQMYAIAAAGGAGAAAAAAARKQYATNPFLSALPSSPPSQPQSQPQPDETTQIEAASASAPVPAPAPAPAPSNDDDSTPPDFESIKNGSENKSSDVPDVPPPPIPSGAKTKSSSSSSS